MRCAVPLAKVGTLLEKAILLAASPFPDSTECKPFPYGLVQGVQRLSAIRSEGSQEEQDNRAELLVDSSYQGGSEAAENSAELQGVAEVQSGFRLVPALLAAAMVNLEVSNQRLWTCSADSAYGHELPKQSLLGVSLHEIRAVMGHLVVHLESRRHYRQGMGRSSQREAPVPEGKPAASESSIMQHDTLQ